MQFTRPAHELGPQRRLMAELDALPWELGAPNRLPAETTVKGKAEILKTETLI